MKFLTFKIKFLTFKVCAIIVIVALSCKGPPSNLADQVTIYRDTWGIPHIYGETDAAAVYGFIYAQCEDDFPRIELNYIKAMGLLAQVEGESQVYHDLRAKMFITKSEAMHAYESSPEWLKELCIAWSDGINHYLDEHTEVEPKLIHHFEPWMPMFFSEGSISSNILRVDIAGIESMYSDSLLFSKSTAISSRKPPSGSNGIAIKGNKINSGNAMLLINPHTSFYFRGEAHVESKEGLSTYGAYTWGQFFFYQGFNENLGWMHTTSDVDVIDQYIESFIKQDGLFYVHNDSLKPVEVTNVKIPYSSINGLRTKEFKIYKTHHGPVTHLNEANEPVTTALMIDPSKALQQSFLRNKASTFNEFKEVLDYRANSSNNTVYADKEGNIAFYYGNFVPRRKSSTNFSDEVDGSDIMNDWNGKHEVDELVQVVNPPNDWVQNCNSTPFTSAGKYSPDPKNYPSYMALDIENYRGIHAINLLEKAESLTLDDFIDLAYDPYLPYAEEKITDFIQAAKRQNLNDKELQSAIEIMETWDYKADIKSVALSIFLYHEDVIYDTYSHLGFKNDLAWMKHYQNEVSDSKKMEILKKSLNMIKNDFGRWNIEWGEIMRYQRLNEIIDLQYSDSLPSIPIGYAPSYMGALATFEPSYESDTKLRYGESGNSFVAVIQFGDTLLAKSVLVGGQSGDPSSRHFDDQIELYAKGQFKDVLFYLKDIKSNLEAEYKPGRKNVK